LVSANTMMMNGRERIRDVGILKSIGFTDARVFLLLTGEALVIAIAGAVLGAGGAFAAFNLAHWNPKPDFFPVFYLPAASLAGALVIALLTGLLSGLVPAVAALRMKAIDALRAV
jgi:putative ABC transport system permease protein